METSSVEELYDRYVRPLSAAERLRLVAMIANDLSGTTVRDVSRKRSLLELEGLGAEIWQGVDAQDYVNKLREEWDHCP